MTFTNSLSQRVIELNNEAIASSLKGLRQDAVITLQRALSMLLTVQDAQKSSSSSSSPRVRRRAEAMRVSNSVPLAHEQIARPFDDVFAFFNRAITISSPDDDDDLAGSWSLSCPQNRSRLQATLLYNLGLICHTEAIQTGSSLVFHNSLQFYGGAYQVLEAKSRVLGLSPDESLILVAIFNNMGHIHSSCLMNREKTQQCMQWMQSAFAVPRIQKSLDAEEHSFFSQYISVPAQRQLLLSPAA